MSKPYIGQLLTVEDQWTDYNGHLNMAYYAVLFDRSAEEMFETFGLGPDYVKATNCSFFTLETHTTYAQELHAGEKVRIENQIIDADHKRVHYVQQMFHAEQNYLSCVLEVMVAHVDLTAKRMASFPTNILAKIDAMAASHKALALPKQVGHKIGIVRKA
ncbi:MAG: thioesterase family protein [Alphaproteobacteria bacterium]|nr:thioesterase family protein [Alphaproteobacteria bacterium]